MPFKDLLDRWTEKPKPTLTDERYAVRLPVRDAARLQALADMFPGTDAEQIITDLLSAGLDEVEAAMPYVAGSKVIREDEFGDPVYEDVGMTPKFLDLIRQHEKRLLGS